MAVRAPQSASSTLLNCPASSLMRPADQNKPVSWTLFCRANRQSLEFKPANTASLTKFYFYFQYLKKIVLNEIFKCVSNSRNDI